jgi:NADH-quinone oxidoreductase subunit L
MFHFFTHAFFKALLFLGAGAVILACHHEQNIFKMGGLRRELPLVFWTFLIGGAALAGFPLVTAGFYSKDFILDHAWHFARGGHWLWAAGMLGAFLTALYTFRLIFIVFFGEAHGQGVAHRPGRFIAIPLTVLAFFSVTAGLVQTPHWLGGIESLRGFLGAVFPARAEAVDVTRELILAAEASAVGIAGLLLAYWLYGRGRPLPSVLTSDAAASLAGFFRRGWDFDRLYDVLFVRPFAWVANVNRGDAIDAVYTAIASAADSGHRAVRTSQTGRLRWYAAALAGGAALVIAIVVLL